MYTGGELAAVDAAAPAPSRRINLCTAINDALHIALAADPKWVLLQRCDAAAPVSADNLRLSCSTCKVLRSKVLRVCATTASQSGWITTYQRFIPRQYGD